MKRLLCTAALVLASSTTSARARADSDSYFLYPQLGLGTGPAQVAGYSSRVASADFIFGNDWEVAGPIATGFIAGFQFERAQWDVRRDWWRFSLTSMWTGSIGYWDPLPFLRVGVGPSLAFTQIAARDVYVGLGLTAEAAAGFRSIGEVYAQASSVFDAAGVSTSATAGFRLNVWVFDLLFGGGGGHHHGSRSHPSRTRYGPSSAPHRAVPAG